MTTPDQPFQSEPASTRPAIRIGDAERNAAVDALGEHLGSGRLNLDEYGERATKVTNARTMDDIEAVFGDLPEPRPVGAAMAVPAAASPAVSAAASPAVQQGPNKALIALIAAMPFIALGLFFATDLWYFFILIPLVGALAGPFINRDQN